MTIRELQAKLPWTIHYHKDFRASPMAHKDFAHALTHVFKAAGKLASVVNDAEHGGSEFKAEEVDRFVADLVVCALRMATTCPGRQIDLQDEVIKRIETKNQQEVRGVPQGTYTEKKAKEIAETLFKNEIGRELLKGQLGYVPDLPLSICNSCLEPDDTACGGCGIGRCKLDGRKCPQCGTFPQVKVTEKK